MSGSTQPFPPALIQSLRRARHMVVLTGAGISAESGIPTFRDRTAGIWRSIRPETVATAAGFDRNPQQVWEWYVAQQRLILAASPNPGHRALATLATHVPSLTLVTQNIDGLHQRAGSPAVLELHGSIFRMKCRATGHGVLCVPMPERQPTCSECGSLMRPDVVWFEEPIASDAFALAQGASFDCDIFMVIGTSGLVAPAATLPMTARGHGAILIDVNREDTPLSKRAHYKLRGAAGDTLPALVEAAWPTKL